jgi:putative MATE family efflux protein
MNNNLQTQDIPVLLKKMSIPLSTGMFFQTMYNVVDTFYAGFLSTQCVAAISLGFIFFYILVGIGNGLGTTLTSLIGNCFGKKKNFLASLYAFKGFLFICIVGTLCSIIGYLCAPYIFLFLGATDDYLQLCLDYINIIIIGNIFFMINTSCNAILNGLGDTKTFRNTLIFGFFANIALNPLFMYGFWFIPALGLKGIALSTVFVQIIIMFYLIKKVLNTSIINFKVIHYFLPEKRIYKELISQGIPSSLNIVIMGIGAIILMYFISDYGYKAVAGYGIAFRVETILLMPALGLSTSTLILVSTNYGAKEYKRVVTTLYLSLKYGFIICGIGALFLYIFGESIIKIFDADKEVIRFSMTYLVIQIWVFFALLTLYVCVSVLQGIKKPKMVFYIGMYRQVIAQIAIAFIIVKYLQLDITYLWLGILVMVYSAAIYLYLYTKKVLNESTIK